MRPHVLKQFVQLFYTLNIRQQRFLVEALTAIMDERSGRLKCHD